MRKTLFTVCLATFAWLATNTTAQTVAFTCDASASGWQIPELGRVLQQARQHQSLLASSNRASAGKPVSIPRPDFKLEKQRLETAMNGSLMAAQHQSSGAPADAEQTAVTVERKVAASSAEFANASNILKKILESYRQFGFTESYSAIGQCVDTGAIEALNQIRQLANLSALYSLRSTTSDDRLVEMGSRVEVQNALSRDLRRVQYLASYAAPYLQWLKDRDPPGRVNAPRLAPIVAYWSNTVAATSRHRLKKGLAGPVQALEAVFAGGLGEISYRNCHIRLPELPQPPLENDLFSERRDALSKQLTMRCDDQQNAQAAEAYSRWAQRFNQELAGNYPFGDLGANDAGPQTVQRFFVDYAAERPRLREKLASRKGARWAKQLSFLDQLDAVARLLLDGQLIGTSMNIAIRSQPQLNSPLSDVVPGHTQLVEWSASTNVAATRWPLESTPRLDWSFGQPIMFTLRWADRSMWHPSASKASDGITADGAQVDIPARGTWALLRLLDQWGKRAEPGLATANGNTWPIEFRVPVRRAEPLPGGGETGVATFSFDVTLTALDPATSANKPLGGPLTFPRIAPARAWQ
jgi:type VI secretion system protein ImpL